MPALYMDSEAVVLCVKVGCCGLALLEIYRYECFKCKRGDGGLGEVFKGFKDEKDSKGGGGYEVFLSHISLLFATVATVRRDGGREKYIGIVLVCVCDSMSAVVGSLYGRYKIPGNLSPRTLEGFTAFLLTAYVWVRFGMRGGKMEEMDLLGIYIVSAMEAGTEGIDNIILPVLGAVIWV
ncbi:hypothetical protein TrVE_jg7282 [Triparma verrucosa]|uniref:dolichol kinase n=1 Tax=Triparma verrucosa TaxID=1606542 RepID=A0A9W7F4S6_9STRA|nr:hypothetical protein TrVE_jg7282 [Triparma verrucosa]